MKAIIVADPNEINKFHWPIKEIKKINQFTFTIFENNIIFVHSGIGIANAAACTQALINNFNIKYIYNYGAVGGNKQLKVYDVIIPQKIFYHDVTTPWYKRGQTPGEKPYFMNALKSKNKINLGSGSSFITDESLIEIMYQELKVSIFDMETAAIAQIADKNNIPFSVIKVVSDTIGSNNISNEDINVRIAKAGKIAFQELLKII